MATYHTAHPFAPGMNTTVWNPGARKHELKLNPHFCAVCGRRKDHILHPVPGEIPHTRNSRSTPSIESWPFDSGPLIANQNNAP